MKQCAQRHILLPFPTAFYIYYSFFGECARYENIKEVNLYSIPHMIILNSIILMNERITQYFIFTSHFSNVKKEKKTYSIHRI